MTVQYSNALINARLTAVTNQRDLGAGPGKIGIYDGTRPARGAAITTQVLLAEVTMNDPSSPAPSGQTLTMNVAGMSTTGLANGTATWFREVDSDDNFVMDGDAGTSGTDMILNTAAITVGIAVTVASNVITGGQQ